MKTDLKGDLSCDVAVIGGGLAGLLTAYLAVGSGKSVVVLEKETVGSGATALTTAFVTQLIDTPLGDQVRVLGERDAVRVWKAGGKAIDLIEHIVHAEGIACDYTRCNAYAFEEGEDPRAGASTPRQAKFDAGKFVRGLAEACRKRGVRIFEHTEATAIDDGPPHAVRTAHGRVLAKDVVVATYVPFDRPRVLAFKTARYVSYVLEAEIPLGHFEEAIYMDGAVPYHYFRVDPLDGRDRLILGGEDHRAELPVNADKRFAALERYLHRLMIGTSVLVMRRWTGPIIESVDGLPFIGRVAPGRYVATAFSGNGMTYAAITALLLNDLIDGVQNPCATVFDPRRRLSLRRLAYYGIHFLRMVFRMN
jgi:glycine/D-amino acid oxidase-like deaminating enzyme